RADALTAQLCTPGGWNVTRGTPETLTQLSPDDIRAFDLVTVELSLASADRGALLKDLAITRAQGPIMVTAEPDASAQALAAALAHGADGLAVCDGESRKTLESAARLLGERDADATRRRLLAAMTESHCTFEVENDPDLLPALITRLQNSVTMFSVCDSAERARIGVAIEEALSNALYHGNLELDSGLRENGMEAYYALATERRAAPPYCDRKIHVTEMLNANEIKIIIRDEGPGFDTSRLDPVEEDDADEEAEFVIPSGRGLMLMQAFMDDVSYNASGNEVTLIKRRAADASDIDMPQAA
ncbi:MAG: ATP-binding protein, partial [Algisphaera sp.]